MTTMQANNINNKFKTVSVIPLMKIKFDLFIIKISLNI
jgi:hypothetical protein